MNSEHDSALQARMTLPQFPRSAKYDPQWMLDNEMGPNAVWLTEWLCEVMDLKPGMRVLDLGCGKAMSSIFLAREFGVQVWAADLWIAATENRERIEAAGLADQIFPLNTEAHALPFADKFFDAVISVDAYHYFGTDDLYLSYLVNFLKPGAQMGIVIPSLMQPLQYPLPDYFTRSWEDQSVFWDPRECGSFHTCDWWKEHWEKTDLVTIEQADTQPEGWKHWLLLEEIKTDRNMLRFGEAEREALKADQGRYFGFIRLAGSLRRDIPEPWRMP